MITDTVLPSTCYLIALLDFEIMPLNGLSWEPTILLSFPYATKHGGSKNKSRRTLECRAILTSLATDDPPKRNNSLIKRIVIENPKSDSSDSRNRSKLSLHLLKLHEGLESCSTMDELKQYHSQIIKLGVSDDNDAIGRVIKFCVISKNGDLVYALKVFDKLPYPDAFIYNTIFRGYLQYELAEDCISFYSQMLQNSVTPNKFSFPPVIRACSFHNAIKEGKQIHAQILKFGFCSDKFSQNNLIHMYISLKNLHEARKVFDKMPQKDIVSWTTLISGYTQSGFIDEGRKLFDLMPERNPISWNAMISAYIQTNRFHESILLFNEMQSNNIKFDKFLAASMLSACTGLGALKQGEWIHNYINKKSIELDSKLATSIIDMYCKCGSLEKALETFNTLLPTKSLSISSYNSMIGGFAIHGKGDSAIELFKKMERTSVSPDYITFVNLLSACAHSGLVEKGRYYFEYMVKVYGISPGMEHYGCMVDMLGRAGKLDEAMHLINSMPMEADVAVMGALLGACKIHKNLNLAEKIGEKVINLDPNNSGRYVLLSNIFANASKWESAAKIRKLMNDRGVKKSPGFSQIEIEGEINEFIAGGRGHRDSKEIYVKVGEMLDSVKTMGYVVEGESGLDDVSEEDVENPLFYHSEKLAIGYGLLKGKPGEVLRITKNLRVCKDCHEVSKLVSKIYGREIVVRDRSRFHHFKDGVCSCNDYW